MHAQLVEVKAAHSMREEECGSMQRELASYAATFDKLQEQQQALYQQHVREIREL